MGSKIQQVRGGEQLKSRGVDELGCLQRRRRRERFGTLVGGLRPKSLRSRWERQADGWSSGPLSTSS